eukprot:TRINITY_DN12613_c0_g1_i5.p1 TRINITY_DN12613_c0_g1~~TRINITY_DN12613_c0_g1_i5.p1  ORF type:complete len:1245 (-),score=403.57 TRINITY_DN12613_c0_g1_i5:581-4315(-)
MCIRGSRNTVPVSDPESQSAMVQRLGEILAASDLVTSLASSDGGALRLNVSNTEMGRINAYGVSLLAESKDFAHAQNTSNTHGTFIEASASCATYFTPYSFLADRLSNWTYMQAYSRNVYFGSLDQGTERNFVIIVFAFAAIGYISSQVVASVAFSVMSKERGEAADPNAEKTKNMHMILNDLTRMASNKVDSGVRRMCSAVRYSDMVSEERCEAIAAALNVSPTNGPKLARIDTHGANPEARTVLFIHLEKMLSQLVEGFEAEAEAAEEAAADAEAAAEEVEEADEQIGVDPQVSLEPKADVEAAEAEGAEAAEAEGAEECADAKECAVNALRGSCPKDARRQRLLMKAIEFVRMAEKGKPVFKALRVQSTFGERSWQWQLYRLLNMSWMRGIFLSFMVLFILCAFIEDRDTKTVAAIICLIPYTLDTAATTYLDPSWDRNTLLPILMNTFLWGTTMLAADADLHSERGITLLNNFFRPWMLLAKNGILTDALKLLGRCLFDARSIFFYLFTVVAIAAIMVNLIFWKKFDADNGQVVDTFLDSVVYMFIYLTSGENWDVLVYQGYRVDKWSAVLWIFLSLFGIFALVSMVIATFETTYKTHRAELDAHRVANDAIARNIAFQCLTWDAELRTTSREIQQEERLMDHFKELPNCVLEEFLRTFMGEDEFNIDERVNPLLMFPGETEGKVFANTAQLDHHERVQTALKVMIVLQDVDDNLSITLQEFEQAIVAAKCTVHLRGDVLISAEAMLLRAAELVRQTSEQIASCPAWERKMKMQLKANLEVQEERLKVVKQVCDETESVIKGLVGISPSFSLDRLDVVMVVLMLFHAFWLSLWGTSDQDVIRTIAAVFAGLYLTEIVLRVHVVKGFKAFFNDRRGATYRFQNGLMLCLAVCGTVAQTLSYILPSRYDPLCQGLAALQLWRILAVEIHFRQISHAFFLGLKPVQLFISLLLLVMFTYCVFATYFFHDVENDDGTMSFKTLEDTCLTMHQVFIGEGWHSVMQDSVDRTNKALIWFFASYVLVVGVLFSNLFVGILINMFQYGTEMYGELGGRVRLEMSQFTPDCTEEDFERLLLNLGHIGEIIHFPRRTLHAAIHERYQDRIEQTGGHLYSWASSLVVSGFRRVVHNATRNKLKFLEEQLPAGITSTAARMAVVEAAREFGADDTGHMVTDDTTLFAVVHSTCEKLALGVERTEWMGEELRRRRAAYLRLFEERRLSPDARAAYKGLPDPSKAKLHGALNGF